MRCIHNNNTIHSETFVKLIYKKYKTGLTQSPLQAGFETPLAVRRMSVITEKCVSPDKIYGLCQLILIGFSEMCHIVDFVASQSGNLGYNLVLFW